MSSHARNMSRAGSAIEPRAITVQDLILVTVGVACASALPSGLGWFDPRSRFAIQGFELAVSFLIWGSCLGAVGLAFAAVGRHARYGRMASPAEWLAIILASKYLALAVTQLHAESGSASILVNGIERGLHGELGSIGRLSLSVIMFAVVVVSVGVLFRYAGLSAFLCSLLGAAVGLLWHWGPCAVWAYEVAASVNSTPFGDTLSAAVLAPALPLAILPMVVGYWALFSRRAGRNWNQIEFACLLWFVGTVALMYWHPAVRYYRESTTFLIELFAFAFFVNLLVVPFGWGAAVLSGGHPKSNPAKNHKE